MPWLTRVRTMPCTVDAGSSNRPASSDSVIRRAPWRATRTRMARSTDWITCPALLVYLPVWSFDFPDVPCVTVNHGRMFRLTFDIIECHSRLQDGRRVLMLDETSLTKRMAAEVIGTAFLVFIGVGSVPAT